MKYSRHQDIGDVMFNVLKEMAHVLVKEGASKSFIRPIVSCGIAKRKVSETIGKCWADKALEWWKRPSRLGPEIF